MSQIHHVLITHDHADHIKSVGSFSKDYQVPVYATEKVHEGINKNYCVQQKVLPELKRFVEKGKTIRIGNSSSPRFLFLMTVVIMWVI